MAQHTTVKVEQYYMTEIYLMQITYKDIVLLTVQLYKYFKHINWWIIIVSLNLNCSITIIKCFTKKSLNYLK